MRGLAVFVATVAGMLITSLGVVLCLLGILGFISYDILPWSFWSYAEGVFLILVGFGLAYAVRQLVKEELV